LNVLLAGSLVALITAHSVAQNAPTANSSSNGLLQVTVMDSLTGQTVPARVRITRRDHVVKALPKQAIAVMYGLWDHADGYGFQPDSAFYADGYFELALAEGKYTIAISKGPEYLDQRHTVIIARGKQLSRTFRLQRWINMPERGWYAADDHIHIRRSPREDTLLMKWIQAEDIHVGVLLRMGDFWATYYEQYGWGEKGVYQEGNHLLTSGQEDPRTPELGHAIGLGASDKVRYQQEYYYYDKVFDKLHQLGGMTGYAHQAESFHGYRGLMLDGLRGKVDMLELLQFCVSEDPLQLRHYYHLLDLGYAVTAVAGSDFPWCGKDHDHGPPERNARIGNARFYTRIEGPLSYLTWKKSLRQGHTFVSSGPVLDLMVNNARPGDTLHVKKRKTTKITVHAYGHSKQVPLQRLELVKHGQVIATVKPGADQKQSSSHLSIEMNVEATEGFWIAARSYANAGQAAHTTPVYVSVDKGGFHNKATIDHYITLAEKYLTELEENLRELNNDPQYQSWRYKKGIEQRIAATRKVLEQLKIKPR
jgi:hypothetical protein